MLRRHASSRCFTRTLGNMARTAALALATLTLTACPEVVTPDDIIEVAPGLPQGSEAPTGDPNSPLLPQIETLSAPETVRPRSGGDHPAVDELQEPALINGVGIVVEGVNGWFIAEASPRPGGESDGGLDRGSADRHRRGHPRGRDEEDRVRAARARQPARWVPRVEPRGRPGWAGQLRGRGRRGLRRAQLRLDPICGTSCGSCGDRSSCTVDGQCEGQGAACEIVGYDLCGGRACGEDPFGCGNICGTCPEGVACLEDGLCDSGSALCETASWTRARRATTASPTATACSPIAAPTVR